MTKKTAYLWGAILVLMAAYWLRVMDLQTLPAGLHRDEAVNVWRAWRYATGEGMPLYFETSPEPFDTILRAPFMAIVGPLPFIQRLFSVWLGVLSVAAVMAAGRMLYRDHPYRGIIALVAGITLAANPSAVMVNRQILRANWIPLWAMLTVTALAFSWWTGKRRYYFAAGVFTGLTTSFYLAGLVMIPTIALILGIGWLLYRRTRERLRKLVLAALGIGVAMLPWFYLFLRIDGWLSERTAQVNQTDDLTATPINILNALWISISRLWAGNGETFKTRAGMVYGTLHAGMLNWVLLALLVIGLLASLIRWRKAGRLTPLLIGVLALFPAALTSHPENQLRLIMLWGPVALVAGLGAGTVAGLAARLRPANRGILNRVLAVLLIVLLGGSTLHTAANIQYHFREDPAIHDDPEHWFSLKNAFQLGYNELSQIIAASEEPLYVPVTLLEHSIGGMWLNVITDPEVSSWQQTDLLYPDGQVIMPNPDTTVDIPVLGLEMQYVLIEPGQNAITILPPLTISTAQTLQAEVIAAGEPITGAEGWLLGYGLPVTGNQNPFNQSAGPITSTALEGDEILGVFDDNLELVGLDTIRAITPGYPFPVTMYWRLREATNIDYFAFVQPYAYTEQSQGTTNKWLLRWLYPTPQWEPGEIVPVTFWVNFYENAPEGAYRYIVSAYHQPNNTPVRTTDPAGIVQENNWLLIGQSVVPLPESEEPPPTASMVDIRIGDEETGIITLNHVAVANETLKPGDVLDMSLYWSAETLPADDYTIFLHMQDADGNLIAQQDVEPLDGQYPTGYWLAGERIVTNHQIAIPADAQGPYTIYGGLYEWPSLERLPVTEDGEALPDGRALLWMDAE